jgi:hypothetical protein
MFRRNLLRGLIVAVVSSVGGSLSVTAEAKASTVWSFDKDEVGRAPAGFEFAVTAKKQPGKWVIVKDGDNHVLAQVDRNKTERRFAMALVENSSYKNLKISVKAKPVAGDVEMVAGLVPVLGLMTEDAEFLRCGNPPMTKEEFADGGPIPIYPERPPEK